MTEQTENSKRWCAQWNMYCDAITCSELSVYHPYEQCKERNKKLNMTENSIEEIFVKFEIAVRKLDNTYSSLIKMDKLQKALAEAKQQLITFLLNHKGKPKKMEFTDSKNGCGCGVCNQIEIHNQSVQDHDTWLSNL